MFSVEVWSALPSSISFLPTCDENRTLGQLCQLCHCEERGCDDDASSQNVNYCHFTHRILVTICPFLSWKMYSHSLHFTFICKPPQIRNPIRKMLHADNRRDKSEEYKNLCKVSRNASKLKFSNIFSNRYYHKITSLAFLSRIVTISKAFTVSS